MSEPKGLYDKYMVIKVVDGTVIDNCFILCPDKDPAAVKALQAYAAATENKVLANDLYAWVGKPMLKPLTEEEATARVNSGHPIYVEEKRNDDAFNGYALAEDAEDAINYMMDEYGTGFRFWASKPTDEERAAAPWEE